jgi:hypothetical protein
MLFFSPRRWAHDSQLVARRNAMAACTALAARRIERTEVAGFVAEFLAPASTARSATPTGDRRTA